MKTKRFLGILLTLTMLMSLLPTFSLMASAETITGECGSNVTYELADGILTIRGTGAMTDYKYSSEPYSPWKDNQSIKSVVVETGVTTIGNCAFRGCSNLTTVTIPASVTTIGTSAFNGCTNLTGVTIPEGVTTIGNYAFNSCKSLTSVTIPEGVTTIGYYAFSGCTGLTNVTLPDSVTTIEDYAFSGCTSLTSVTIPPKLTTIKNFAFSGCTSLTSVTISEGVYTIDGSAFRGCTKLESVTMPSSLDMINSLAFSGCTGLTNVTIPEGVVTIGGSAFYGCTNLTSVTLPSSLTRIGNYAFSGCTNLTSVIVNRAGNTSFGTDIFKNCDSLELVTVPDTYSGTNFGGKNVANNTSYTVTCNTAENGTVQASTTSATAGTTVTLTVTPDNGYELENLAVTLGETPVTTTKDTAGNYTFTMPAGDVTVTVSFQVDLLVVTFDAQNGTCDTTTATAGTDGKLTGLPETTRTGFTFLGWFDAATGGNQVTVNTEFTQDTTIYAQWSVITEHTLNWEGYHTQVNEPTIDLREHMPQDSVITTLTPSFSVGAINQIAPSWSESSAKIKFKTNVLDAPMTDVLKVVVKTSNYGNITFTINIHLIASEIKEFAILSNGKDGTNATAIVAIPTAGTYTLIFADYEETRLNNVDTVTVTAENDSTVVTVTSEKDITLGTGDKIMLWQDMTTLVPLCEAYVVK